MPFLIHKLIQNLVFVFVLSSCLISLDAKSVSSANYDFDYDSDINSIKEFDESSAIKERQNEDTRIVFPFPQTPVPDSNAFLPNLGLLTDLSFLLLPEFPASGLVRVARDVFESEQCVEKTACMVTKMTYNRSYLGWIHNFMMDFPFQGELADRLRDGTMTYMRDSSVKSVCSQSCNPIKSVRRAFSMMRLLNDLITVNLRKS